MFNIISRTFTILFSYLVMLDIFGYPSQYLYAPFVRRCQINFKKPIK